MTKDLTQVLNAVVNEQGSLDLNFETEQEEGLENINIETEGVDTAAVEIELPEVEADDKEDDLIVSYENGQAAVILRNNINSEDRIGTATAINNAMKAKSIYPETFDFLNVVATMVQYKKGKGLGKVLSNILEAIENKGKGYLKIVAKEAKERKVFKEMIMSEIIDMAYAEKVPYDFTEKFLEVYYKDEFSEELYELFKSDKCIYYNERLYQIIEEGVSLAETLHKMSVAKEEAMKTIGKELFDRLSEEYASLFTTEDLVAQIVDEVTAEDKEDDKLNPIEEGVKNLIASVEEATEELVEAIADTVVVVAKEVHEDATDYLGEEVYKTDEEDKVVNAEGDVFKFSKATKRWNYAFDKVAVAK